MKLQRILIFDRGLLLSFFDPLTFTIAVEALIERTSKGALWLDDPNDPSLGILWDFADGIYLVSKGCTDLMVESIQKLFQEEIIPEAEKRCDSPVFVIYS
ncbi:MAG: hypothetical protein KAR20_26690, partial [Candidatus Heimdallarchaeota archaeon]|nr:hypothetical protein [Candidatus Heimdallarchaeota archaeon]